MSKSEALKQISVIDRHINACRRAEDRNREHRLFELRGWYQLLRDTAGNRYAKREHATAELKVVELGGVL
jgi:hypothetical protein